MVRDGWEAGFPDYLLASSQAAISRHPRSIAPQVPGRRGRHQTGEKDIPMAPPPAGTPTPDQQGQDPQGPDNQGQAPQGQGVGPAGNMPEFSVSELSNALKRVVEDRFAHVRVRAEVGRVTFHGNGHVYLDLKDEKAVINGVVWRSSVSRLKIRPEQGLEVIATGRLTTYPGRSQYQIIIEQIEAAGVGALMALLEERKKKLAAEGLFAEERKKPLPFLPEVIGVITSPTGAVIRDIMHRIADRFPRRVLLWPVIVQGDQAAGQVSDAIAGFNALKPGGAVPRPDVLIVARGGGSIEDLWAFNEEAVVRAVAASTIPVISAVGHETDTTLIDYVSDRRAPTPTGAAEMAVPVQADLVADVLDLARRLVRGQSRLIDERRQRLVAAARTLPRAQDMVAQAQQRLDYAGGRLATALTHGAQRWRTRLEGAGARLRVETLRRTLERRDGEISQLARRLERAQTRRTERARDRLETAGKLLRTLSYQGTLARGYALVRDAQGGLVRAAGDLEPGQAVSIEFADGKAGARIDEGAGDVASVRGDAAQPARKKTAPKAQGGKTEPDPTSQGSLF